MDNRLGPFCGHSSPICPITFSIGAMFFFSQSLAATHSRGDLMLITSARRICDAVASSRERGNGSLGASGCPPLVWDPLQPNGG